MQNLYNDLDKILEKDERLFAEGKILKNKITELAINQDSELLGMLLNNSLTKKHFFAESKTDNKTVFIFNQDKFVKFINNKEFLPDSFTTFKNHIGLVENDEYLKDGGKVVLAWPYKDCVLEGGQDKEDTKRNEIFYNEILAPDEIDRLFEPKVLTNLKKIDKTGEHKVQQLTEQENLIIKGNNLLALHSLKKKYRDVYLLRNERLFKIYRFSDGQAIEPDFVLFLKEKSGKKILSYQLFVEPKGNRGLIEDKWKEDFLVEIEKEFRMEMLYSQSGYKLIGLPFYNEQQTKQAFDKVFREKLKV